MKSLFIFLTFAVTGASAFFTDWFSSSSPDWNDLKVTWGINPLSSIVFQSQPRTVQDAIDEGFVQISACDTTANWRGARYVKDDDLSLILLYDVRGFIAGIQTAVSKSVTDYPSSRIRPPFVSDGDRWVLTAYFVDPISDTICTTGRNGHLFEAQGTGYTLMIQNSTDLSEMITIPKAENALGKEWTLGKCFYTMGVHYWYNVREDMSCDEFFPVFLLYNGGKLNAFGWAMGTMLPSPRLEHPDESVFDRFLENVPQCLVGSDPLSTLHIYLTSTPRLNLC